MSHETFKVGEIAVVVMAPDHDLVWPELVGEEVEIVSGLQEVWVWADRAHTFRFPETAYICRTRTGEDIACLPESLRKRPPPREQTSTWDDVIVWRPKSKEKANV